MPKIIQLSAHVANLIAAGEVVERPASVVKELLENAVDAGASQVTVELRDGGMTFLRVTDNGCGMTAEDARTAFLRHATSKLRCPEDLNAIGTMGFRGEALAAIADKATKKDTGARALRAIIEDFMLDIMYEIPKDDNIGRVTITKNYIEGTGGPAIQIRGAGYAIPDKQAEAAE